ncbi:hypothetical protein [Actinomyces vulturis]|uniref:hypothetical protein n=1 Tax=Actinomyces vulturis TaxID=1857645 RepID=UPI0008322F70|nr:hypothetical protein [Actinomyces vulturis]
MPKSAKESLAGVLRFLYTDLRPLDFILGALIVIRDTSPIHTPVLPSDLAMAGIILIGLSRNPTRQLRSAETIIAAYIPLAFYLYIVSSDIGTPAIIRLSRITAMIVAAIVISSGQIHIKSLLAGIFSTIVINIPLFYLGIAPASYEGSLTGFLGDKNLAGAIMACYFIILLSIFPKKIQILLSPVFLFTIYLTNSRTSISAFLAAITWLLLRRFMTNVPLKIFGIFIGYTTLNYATENFAHEGDFESHAGSDILRARIDAATEAKNSIAPWHGTGLTTAQVELEGRNWFFHNSYRGLFQEGGWPFLIIFLLFIAIFCLSLFKSGPSTGLPLYTEAATIALLVCSWRLGEVFLSTPFCVLYGLALHGYTSPLATKNVYEQSPQKTLRSNTH